MANNTNLYDDAMLLAGLKRGDEAIYRQLFDLYYRKLVFFANKILFDVDLSRSVVQDVFVMMFDKRDEINIHTSLNAHLHQSVKNRCLNIIKREKMKRDHHQRIFDSSNEAEEPEEKLEYNELENCINNVIEQLPEQCKKVFVMSRHESFTNQEIAERLDISKRTVETQISKAIKRIKTELSKQNLITTYLLIFFNQFF